LLKKAVFVEFRELRDFLSSIVVYGFLNLLR